MSDEIDQLPEIPATASPVAPGTHDRNGVPFDPARHLPKQHPRTGRWMPKGGRKPKPASSCSPSTSSQPASTDATPPAAQPPTSSPSPVGSLAAADPTAALGAEMAANMPEVTVKDPAPAPAAPGKPATLQPTTPAGSFIPTDIPADPLPAVDAKAEVIDADAKSSAEDNAEVACQTLYSLTGLVTGQQKEAMPAAPEHAALRRTLAAYFRARGWVAVGTVAVVVSVLAYLIRTSQKEATSQVARGWWARLWQGRRGAAANVGNDAAGSSDTSTAPAAAPTHSRVIVVD